MAPLGTTDDVTRRALRGAALLAWLTCSSGCASILGFEDFTGASGSGGDGGSGGTDAGAPMAGTGNTGGSGPSGDACESDEDCGGSEFCVDDQCSDVCDAGEPFCAGSVLRECNVDGDGAAGDGETCASAELCAASRDAGNDDCQAPSCAEGEKRCTGGETELEAQECSEGRTAFVPVDLCDTGGLQCNPTEAACFELDIDETEVTRDAYSEFLAANVDTDGQAAGCAWNDSFSPDADCMDEPSVCDGDCDDHPQVCIDWCDAAAYCEWRGRRLCGAIGDGSLVDFFDGYDDPGESEWMNACSAAGQYEFGHGDDPPETTPDACTYSGRLDTTYAVGSRAACSSPGRNYGGLFDLSGNVAEWENNCETAASVAPGDDTACHVRGGSFEAPLDELVCETVPSIPVERSATLPHVGLRCCAD